MTDQEKFNEIMVTLMKTVGSSYAARSIHSKLPLSDIVELYEKESDSLEWLEQQLKTAVPSNPFFRPLEEAITYLKETIRILEDTIANHSKVN